MDCPPECTHQEDAPGCAISAALERGEIDTDRVASLRRLLSSREGEDDTEPSSAPAGPHG